MSDGRALPRQGARPDPVSGIFPPIEPYQRGFLPVDKIHTLYWEECGQRHGEPVLFLHGGPGAGLSPQHRQFFDPNHYRIVLLDQRGSGQSMPLGECRNNSTPLLIDDIEHLRERLGIARWLVFGGSWGATLALAYGQAHPQRCSGFVLRGIFLGTVAEIDWFMDGIQWFFPDEHQQFSANYPNPGRGGLLRAYARDLFGDDPERQLQAARNWSRYEGSCLQLRQSPDLTDGTLSDNTALALARLEAHYFLHRAFLGEDQLVQGVERIRHLPAVIVQGRYDVICPVRTAWRLHQAWPQARLGIVEDAGHSAFEPGITSALVAATERFKRTRAL